MLKKLVATTIALTFVVAAQATIEAIPWETVTWGWHQAEPVNGTGGGFGVLPNSGTPYFNLRLAVRVTDTPGVGADDWTAGGLDVQLYGPVHFLQDAANDGDPPNPVFFTVPGFEDSEYTSYFTSPGDYPNTGYTGSVVGFAYRDETATTMDVDFFDTIDAGNGDFYLVQLTIVPDNPDDPDFMNFGNWYGEGLLQYAAVNTGGELFDYPFTIIPEPASLALLGLGGLALIRRR